jgi:hypothetical protein
MNMSDRDKKIIIVLAPLLAVVGFWFLVLAPKRSESTKLGTQLEQAQSKRDSTVAQATTLQGSRDHYARDYATVVRLGKAIPSTVDMPSLLVQLDSAAKGTNIDFNEVKAGDRTAATTSTASTSGSSSSGSGGSSSGSGSAPVASGGSKAQTGPGTATESANNSQQTSNDKSAASGADAGTTSSSSSSTSGTTGSGAQGLDSVPLTFAFSGSFFDLADFFHRLKRFVRAANGNVDVKGRLMTIDGLSFKSDTFPAISATVESTVYLSPKTEGTTAGATSSGPQATPASTSAPAASTTNASTSGQGNPQ